MNQQLLPRSGKSVPVRARCGSRSRSPGGLGRFAKPSAGFTSNFRRSPGARLREPFTVVVGKGKPSDDDRLCEPCSLHVWCSVAVPMIVGAVHAIPGPHGRWAVPSADRQLSVFASPAREPARPSSATSMIGARAWQQSHAVDLVRCARRCPLEPTLRCRRRATTPASRHDRTRHAARKRTRRRPTVCFRAACLGLGRMT